MTDLHVSPDTVTGDDRRTDAAPDGLRRFRGSTVEEAVAAAKHDLGHEIEIVEANRIRRGGLGGFFATDLGIEVIVAGPTPSAAAPPPRTSTDRSPEPSVLEAVDRILDRHDATRGDRFEPSREVSQVTVDADTAVLDPHPFATQLARELSAYDFVDEPDLEFGPDVQRSDDRPVHVNAATSDIVPDTDTDTGTDALADIDRLLLGAGITPPADPTTGTSTSASPGVPTAMTADPTDPVPPRVPAAASTDDTSTALVPASTSLPPTELLQAAAERLSEQLAVVAPQAAGRPHRLKKIKLKVSSPDGTSLEMVAEWNDDE